MLPPWVEEDYLRGAPDYRDMADPWGHADLIYQHIGEAILLLWQRVSVLYSFNEDEMYDPKDYATLRIECRELCSWILDVTGPRDEGEEPWVPLTEENRELLESFGGLFFNNEGDMILSHDHVIRLMTRIRRSAVQRSADHIAHRNDPGFVESANRNIRQAEMIVANSFVDEQGTNTDDEPFRFVIHTPARSWASQSRWPATQVHHAQRLYHDGFIREAGEAAFAFLAAMYSLFFQSEDEEYHRTLAGRHWDFVPGVVASWHNVRAFLAQEMENMNAPMMAASLRMPMSDSDDETFRAIDILNEALDEDVPGYYLTLHDGDLILLPPEAEDDYDD